ncbi:DNA-protecting protein DprA [Candidatus Nomurabacteria bacterium]|nr:DNA-protecting protein DprA [Candidatus Nomurabacteria bacterium]
MKINEISPQSNKYLQILANIAPKPKKLYYCGTLPELRLPTVAIVGTRKPTSYGKEVTTKLAEGFARRGVVIVSGLALGVDGLAHKSALNVGGLTLAVLGNGLSYIYPQAHDQLGKQIVKKGGALISEYPPEARARPHYFLERNRIVSGLADIVVITEAASRSGTLNTAMHAIEQGRDVFVVPGPITSPMSTGCNQLLKQGANPITSVDDILDIIAPINDSRQAPLALGSTPLENKVIELIRSGVRDGDELQQKAKTTATELSEAMTMLEINGIIRSLGADQWSLR